ncbi:cytochrome P450 [Amycolatopsis samaneae]|uniref:Cytochrome P450 n=1 Tax=Amycolatopsis samaneae TaxID=664691 RepID=A0ABW5GMH7_9PSEU
MDTEPPPVIDLPLAPPGRLGPPGEYPRLRRECPVARVRMPPEMGEVTAWYVTGYEEVKQVIADRRLVRPSITAWPAPTEPGEGPGLITVMELDGPSHLAVRRALTDAFGAGTIRRYTPRMRRLADGLLDSFAEGGPPGDLVAGFAEPFPLLVMCDLVGIPYAEREYFLPLADAALGALKTLAEGRRSTSRLRAFVTTLIERKRREPAADVLTHLVRECDSGALTEETVVSFGLSMLVAGYRTTTMFLAGAVFTLLTEPGQYARLRDDRDLLPTAVEELLRYLPVMNGVVVLLATEDIVLRGHTIRAGEAVLPVLAAANRDERVFPDPDRLDLARAVNPHTMFGRGAHNCFGAHLARAELAVALGAVLDRFPALCLREDNPPSWDDESPAKSPLTLPVGW